jgi:hypothetical protein
VNSVDRLKDTFCRQHALDLIFTEDGDSYLTAEMYTNMVGSADEVDRFPSPIFQVLFLKLIDAFHLIETCRYFLMLVLYRAGKRW